MVLIKDIMNTEVFTISEQDSIFDATKKMAENGVSCLVITQDEIVKGIVTRRDILEKAVLAKKDLDTGKISEIMTSPVITMKQEGTMIAASGIINMKHIKQLPIVDEKEKLVGIITQTDIVLNINSILKYDRQ